MSPERKEGFIGGVVRLFLGGNLSVLFLILALTVGAVALLVTPREEEPQIVVPLADVIIRVPGASAEQVERQVATRLEKMLFQIDGVEYVYSVSRTGMAVVTVRFYVGEDREDSLVKIYNKMESNLDQVPSIVDSWVVKPVEIDDVPIVNVTLYSERYDDAALRRLAEELETELQQVKDTNRVEVYGGRPRKVRIELDPARLAAHSLSPLEVAQALEAHNVQMVAGDFDSENREFLVEAGVHLDTVQALPRLIVGAPEGKTVRLNEVARVQDVPEETETYTRIGFGPSAQFGPEEKGLVSAAEEGVFFPAVHVAVAKKRGTNAVWVARDVEAKMAELDERLLPEGVHYRITRNYGQTANAKVNELVRGLAVAMIVVVGMIYLSLGWRSALVIAVAIPTTFALTLMINYLLGYTINRVTLFALTLALGIVVDDPIVCVDNISRHLSMGRKSPFQAVLSAMREILPPVILTTVAVVASFAPMFFITGMMGPYMRPMALNVPLALCLSTVVALTVTPWLAYKLLKGGSEKGGEEPWELEKSPIYKFYHRFLPFFLNSRLACWALFGVVGLLFVFAGMLAMWRLVPLKMLPFDNKNEFQVVVDMPEGTTLESTDKAVNALAQYLRTVPEVTDFQTYVGTASPMDFNGMVRQYYMRQGANVGEIRVNLLDKEQRAQQSHALILRIRREIDKVARAQGANIKLVEMPPGPPVVATVTAEVYPEKGQSPEELVRATRMVRQRMEKEAGVVDVDDSFEADQTRYIFVTDKEKAALSGVSTAEVARTLRIALEGLEAGVVHEPDEVNPLPIELNLPRPDRSSLEDLLHIYVKTGQGQLVTLGEIGHFQEMTNDKSIYHKNLKRVGYVFGEMAGRAPAEAILDMEADRMEPGETAQADPVHPGARSYLSNGAGIPWTMPEGFRVAWDGEGEWKITLRVFRDLGLAFAAACVGIYIILVYQTGSFFMPLILMISIPLTMIGIMPGFWLLNVLQFETPGGYENPIFFTATAMIGMIALSGIAVRNAILLIEFIQESLRQGETLKESLIRSGAMRLRPIFLTASTAGLAAIPITLDPIFSGLAWALIFGLTVSTCFTLLLIPVVYWMVYKDRPGQGLPPQPDESS